MGKQTKTIFLIEVLMISIFLHSCTCVHKKDKETGNFQGDMKSGSIDSLTDTVFYLLPSPGEILERARNSSIQYNPGLLNPLANMDKYIGSKAQSLNLGVFISDMAYSAMHNRSSETVSLLEGIKTLSAEVGISTSVFESLVGRAQNNTGNMDSLMYISNEAFTGMQEFLESGGKNITMAIMSAGAYIESFYLILNSVKNYSDGDPVFNLISEMKYPLGNLTEMANKNNEDEDLKSIIEQLNLINQILNEIESSGSKTVISKDQDGVISILGGENFTINENNFTSLKKRITEIRTNIVAL